MKNVLIVGERFVLFVSKGQINYLKNEVSNIDLFVVASKVHVIYVACNKLN